MRRHHKVILGSPQHFRNSLHHLAGEAHQFLLDAQHQRDHVGLAGPQAHTRPVRLVAELARHQSYALLGLGPDIRRIFQRARYGRDPKTRHKGDRLEGRAFVSRRAARGCFSDLVHLAARIDCRHWLLNDAVRLLQKKLKRYR
ncbi:hypothetical protein D3C87_1537090 [compost metagenome]